MSSINKKFSTKKYIDLTGPLENNMWGYHQMPGMENIIPPVQIKALTTVKQDGFFISGINCVSISGTYLESGSHMFDDGKDLDDYTVDDFIKPVKIIRLPQQGKKALISKDLLKNNAPRIEAGDAVIIDTGWSTMWNSPGYVLECPNYLAAALEWFSDKKISILGVDVPCIEAAWSGGEEEEKGGILRNLFRQGTLLLAPLSNLEKIEKNAGTLMCLPLLVKGSSGAPARAIFIDE